MPSGSEADPTVAARRGKCHGAIDESCAGSGEVERVEVDIDAGEAQTACRGKPLGQRIDLGGSDEVHPVRVMPEVIDQETGTTRRSVSPDRRCHEVGNGARLLHRDQMTSVGDDLQMGTLEASLELGQVGTVMTVRSLSGDEHDRGVDFL